MTCVLSKFKIFTAAILSQNYHLTDGFSLKNHPLKEAEKQYKFCFRAEAGGKGVRRGLNDAVRDGALSAELASRVQSCSLRTLTRASSIAR